MAKNHLEDFTSLIKSQEREVPFLEYRVKDLHSIVGVLLTVIDSGFISILMNILNQWSQKHYNATIKISYQSVNNKNIEVTYSHLSKNEIEDILSEHPPRIGSKIDLKFPSEEQLN